MATTGPATANPGIPKKSGPGLWLSMIITAIGLIAVSVGSWVAFDTAFELASVDSFEIPGSETRDLEAADYEIYVRTSTVSIFELDIDDQDVFVGLSDVTVTNADNGESVDTFSLFAEPLGRSTSIYTSVAAFEIDQPGRYTVSIDNEDVSRAVVGRSAESSFSASIPWAILGGVGLIIFVVGCIMLIVGMVRRDRQKREQQAAGQWNAPPDTMTAQPVPPQPSGVAPPPPPSHRGTSPSTPDEPTVGPPISHAPHVEPHQSETETPW